MITSKYCVKVKNHIIFSEILTKKAKKENDHVVIFMMFSHGSLAILVSMITSTHNQKVRNHINFL